MGECILHGHHGYGTCPKCEENRTITDTIMKQQAEIERLEEKVRIQSDEILSLDADKKELEARVRELKEFVKIFKVIASRSNLLACRLAEGGSGEVAEILSLAKLFDRANIKFHGTQEKESE